MKKIKTIMCVSICLFMVMILSGCATAICRYADCAGYPLTKKPDEATRADYQMLKGIPIEWHDSVLVERAGMIMEIPLVLIDLPLSITFDTLFLPCDIRITGRN